jgi:putative membrane protein
MRKHISLLRVAGAVTAVSLVLLAIGSAPAESAEPPPGNPAGMNSATPEVAPGKPAPGEANAQDRLFVQMAAMGGNAEVEFGRLAAQKSRNDAVRRFAQQMVDDHGKANDELQSLARAAGIPSAPQYDTEHELMRKDLAQADGAGFDRSYLQGQLIEHQKTVQLLEWEMGSGQDAGLRQYAERTLPKVMHHLQAVQQLQTQLAATAPPPTTSAAPR